MEEIEIGKASKLHKESSEVRSIAALDKHPTITQQSLIYHGKIISVLSAV